ncbi:hypothetical protein F2Q65_03195 [Thiohalocapsa marina]|uniref:Uncharacterized protein n=1 Tax=Thiohalocapsa marina TaxID=424902 RepID=A0A5M8FQ42_9GAMM|nr:cache domain-containing protein [Thiohalocapsa marina]KAA6186909.1 hypothetical protein F2Q65_03195 [Thiohalocapsa marina]
MANRRSKTTLSALTLMLIAIGLASPVASVADSKQPAALAHLAADRIDAVFRDLAASTRAIGEEYRRLAAEPAPIADTERAAWLARASRSGNTTGFSSWPELTETPPFQAPFPGLYSYKDETTLFDSTLRQLQALNALVPVLRATYNSAPYSWVYLTTADDLMLIYPYVPLAEAVHNHPPTQQLYYQGADFKRRQVGWTLPYLDLVGTGMMITASYPIYHGDQLLGVASRDITLRQLAQSVLSHLVHPNGGTAYIVDARGLAIDAADPDLSAEIEQVNTKKKTAALFYRSTDALAALDLADAASSRFDWINTITDQVLSTHAEQRSTDLIALNVAGRHVIAAPIETTGWLLVMVGPAD